ncbi:TetR/AcrR family transcriptional regulator [Pigmentiphaga aceris]|uniref:TetR/AcrR family transcriptional regulator n=1 Tax=Pigmentiphaga aceris TaxID=1940612 RepID=A0A5C0AVR1_9BURK|nr:TetR/AcrR family transcriptional regulator [Pigmentiphaga aceris]QEI05694.1 TetR/AcrR family transcriptional regulator [Pigmentiphaga aceris]
MATLDAPQEENRLLVALASAMVDRPRATLQELAQAVGVSKATLYRFCRTREQLVERLIHHGTVVIGHAIASAELHTSPPLEALRRLIANNLEHRELSSFLMHYWKDASTPPAAGEEWEIALDTFFLRGQQEGVFRIDLTASVLTELWITIFMGLIDGERRGRIARAGMAGLVERAFLHGAAKA